MKSSLRYLLILTAVSMLASVANAGDWSTKPWLKRPAPKQQVATLPANPGPAMACSKCTTTTMAVMRDVSSKPGRGKQEMTASIHQCKSCVNKYQRKLGTKEMELVHKCTMTGEQSATCCAAVSTARGS